MVFQKVSPEGTSTSNQFAGDVVNKISDLFSAINIAQTDATNKPTINTETRFYSSMLRLLDNNQSHEFYFDTSGANIAEHKGIIIPLLTASSDTLVFINQAQILSNKTLSSPAFSGITSGQLTLGGGLCTIEHTNSGSRLDLVTKNSTLASTVDISFYHWDTNSLAVRSAAITSELADNTPGSVDTYLNFWTFQSGAFLRAFRVQNNGDFVFRGPSGQEMVLRLLGLTSARTFTLPDFNGTFMTREVNETISGTKTFSSPLTVIRTAQVSSGEMIASFRNSDTAGVSVVEIVNASNVDTQFIPWIRSRQYDVSTGPGLYLYSYISAAHDTGAMPAFILDSRKHDDTAITTRPLFSFRTGGTEILGIAPWGVSLGAHFLDFANLAAPANPSAGWRRVFTNSATGELSVKTSAGTVVSLESGGTGGSVAALNDIGDVTITTAVSGDVPTWNGSAWTNQQPPGASGGSFFAKVIGDYLDFERIALPANPTANRGRVYVKQLDADNDVVCILLKKGGAFVETVIA